jgi:hypothetical protein
VPDLQLDRPASADDLYLDRGQPVEPWRPIFQGDVFQDVPLPGVEDFSHVLVSTHACTMRGAGGALKPKLKAIPVAPTQRQIRLEEWPRRHLRVLPLQGLDEDHPEQLYLARLDEVGMVASDDLDLDQRVACLSEQGLWLFQQRLVACDTRTHVKLDTLEEASRLVLEEAELLERWSETLARRRVDAGEERAEALAAEAEEFDAFLGPQRSDTLRARLNDPVTRPAARREVLAEIARRRDALGG